MHFLIEFIALSLGIVLASQSVAGFVVGSFWQVITIAILLFLFQKTVKPVLTILTLPISVISFGFFTIIINGFGVWVLALLLSGFSVSSFWVAVLGSLIISACAFIARLLIKS